MTPTYLSFSPASSPAEELHQAQQDHGEFYCRQQPQEQADKYVPRDEYSSAHSTEQSDGSCKQEHDVMMKGEDHCSTGSVLSVKWMSSKMRLMKKMMNADQTVMNKPTQTTSDTDNSINSSSCHNNNNNNNNIVRTCSDCNTTKTPLWRSGPRGPKSLCNACGIRQRKARRAMAAAQADTLVVSSETSSTSGAKLHMKAKRCKLTARRNRKKLCFEDLAVSLSKNAAYHQVFPQDEKEAAILLMALSCGLALC